MGRGEEGREKMRGEEGGERRRGRGEERQVAFTLNVGRP